MGAALLQMGESRAECRFLAHCATSDGTNALTETPRCGQGLWVLVGTAS